MSAIALEEGRVEELAEMLRLMGDANRVRILMLVLDRPRAVDHRPYRVNYTPSSVSLGQQEIGRRVPGWGLVSQLVTYYHRDPVDIPI